MYTPVKDNFPPIRFSNSSAIQPEIQLLAIVAHMVTMHWDKVVCFSCRNTDLILLRELVARILQHPLQVLSEVPDINLPGVCLHVMQLESGIDDCWSTDAIFLGHDGVIEVLQFVLWLILIRRKQRPE